MKKLFIFIFFVSVALTVRASDLDKAAQDTNTVIKLNKQGFLSRMNNSTQTVEYATKALAIAQKLGYTKGIAESYRIMGIGNYYSNHAVKAIENYLAALGYFNTLKDLRGQAKVYNNIGILYRDNDSEQSLFFLQKALGIAEQLADNGLIASLNFNIGNVYYRKDNFYKALNYFDKCEPYFISSQDSTNEVQLLQSRGVIYYNLNQYDKAEAFLLKANKGAKELGLNEPVASIDITLAALYIAQGKFNDAEKAVEEGEAVSKLIKDEKIEKDFKYTSYQLELKRKNYEKALSYLQVIYRLDSATFKKGTSTQISLYREQMTQQARKRENEILMERQEYDRVKFWGVAVVAGLLLVLVGLLINNVKRKAKNNLQLTNLNAEVSRQKDNLDRINHHLEEIIDERTKDLQVKNKKLSEYSSYLSHQIRGPIATLKGLLNLEKEGLVDQQECIKMMNKCVSEIDDKIIEMSDMLHDPVKTGL